MKTEHSLYDFRNADQELSASKADRCRRGLRIACGVPPGCLLLGCVAVLSWYGCGSKRQASKENFKQVIQAELERNPACISVRVPYDLPSWNGRFREDEDLDALA